MAVLVEANSVIVRVPAIRDRYPGGWPAFDDNVPNNTLCSDGELARVGFMNPNDRESFVDRLQRDALTFLSDGKSQDIAIADQTDGLTVPCDWLEFIHVEMRPGQIVAAVRLKGMTGGQVSCPTGWSYEKSLSRQYSVVSAEHLQLCQPNTYKNRSSSCVIRTAWTSISIS
jgi:hypothetical protein